MLMKWCLWREVTEKNGHGVVKCLISTLGGEYLVEIYFHETYSYCVNSYSFLIRVRLNWDTLEESCMN